MKSESRPLVPGPPDRKAAAAYSTARTPAGLVPFRHGRCRDYSWWMDERQAWVCAEGHESRAGDEGCWERKDKYAPPVNQCPQGMLL